ncbi:WD40_domain-containing protein [Hexamita inflata]|uniref:WD40 domain-containing protein n=1 Tax=Hexamita inflata TaxID=28002 RepID=A0AA86V501_9EUKA|nr:WD40 domain-containing protein [Hexamita inflata]
MSIFTSLQSKIYNLTPKTTQLPAFLDKNERKKLIAADDSYHLIQDGYFPHIATNLLISPNQKFLLAAGSYPHQIRLFDLDNSTMKFQRNQNCETVAMEFLGADWRKFALVLDDKSVEIHSQKGKMFGARVPKPARSIAFDVHEATLNIAGSSSDIYRLDLFKGCFKTSFNLQTEFVNQLIYQQNLELLLAAHQTGVSFIDTRTDKVAGFLPTQVQACSVCSDRNKVVVGLQNGEMLTYDVRSSVPLLKTLCGSHPVKQLQFTEYLNTKYLIQADLRQLRVYEEDKLKFYIEPGTGIYKFQKFENSGLFALACEDQFLNMFYAPDLGPAPSWAKDLDEQVLQLDVQQSAGEFANYKFCTRQELEALGLANLCETGQVITYMHGFYIPKDLYKKQSGKQNLDEIKERKREEAEKIKEKKSKPRADDRFNE